MIEWFSIAKNPILIIKCFVLIFWSIATTSNLRIQDPLLPKTPPCYNTKQCRFFFPFLTWPVSNSCSLFMSFHYRSWQHYEDRKQETCAIISYRIMYLKLDKRYFRTGYTWTVEVWIWDLEHAVLIFCFNLHMLEWHAHRLNWHTI